MQHYKDEILPPVYSQRIYQEQLSKYVLNKYIDKRLLKIYSDFTCLKEINNDDIIKILYEKIIEQEKKYVKLSTIRRNKFTLDNYLDLYSFNQNNLIIKDILHFLSVYVHNFYYERINYIFKNFNNKLFDVDKKQLDFIYKIVLMINLKTLYHHLYSLVLFHYTWDYI